MQAARGTPVDHETDPADRRQPVLASRGAWLVFAAVAGGLYAADQLSKRAALDNLAGRGDVPVVGEVLQLHLTRNPGAAFSLGTDLTVVLTCLAIVATGVVLWVSRRVVDRLWALGLGAMLAGITGNLTDRMLREPAPFHGHVIDFLKLPNWPIFNVADIAINIGALLVLVQVVRGVRLDGTRQPADADEEGPAADDPEGDR